MNNLREDIWAQPAEMARSAAALVTDQSEALAEAGRLLHHRPQAVITGMGSSYFISLAGSYVGFDMGLRSVALDTGELCHQLQEWLADSTLVVVSRSGASGETLRLLEMARPVGCPIIGITNAPDSPLGQAADVVLDVRADLDHNVSIKMYNGPLQALILALAKAAGRSTTGIADELAAAWSSVAGRLDEWEAALEGVRGLFEGCVHQYYLGRGAGYASACEGRLLSEEASKYAATADFAAGFRHGSIEVVREDFRGILFLTPGTPMGLTASLAGAIEGFGGKSIVFAPDGVSVPEVSLTLRFPEVDRAIAPVFDVTPAQLLALKMAEWRSADCNSFSRCSYIIGDEE